jgi:ribose transport system permease protein
VFGRSVLAIGQNIRAARLAGVNVERTRFATYALCGALGGLNGALLAAYFRGAPMSTSAMNICFSRLRWW